MRSIILACIALFAIAVAETPEFFPCSFHVELHTRIMNSDKEVVATSIDHMYSDHDNLWRWDCDFSGLLPFMEPLQWTVIWRPDITIGESEGVSFYDTGDKCQVNEGQSRMYPPYPYDWFVSHTKGVSWFKLTGVWEDMPVIIYHTTFVVKRNKYTATFTADVYILEEDNSLLFINGTAKNDEIDLTYYMDAVAYEHEVSLASSLFIPSARCTNGTVISAPKDASSDFKKQCYDRKNAGAQTSVCWLALLSLLLAILLA